MSKRAILYARVSTDEQAEDGYGLGEQLRELREYADRHGLQIVDEVIDDGYSGASRNRPGLKKIKKYAEAGAIDLVVAAKLDRYFRRASYQDLFAYEMRDFGVEVYALNGQPDDNPAGRMFNRMLTSFAEYERDLITDRITRERMGRARDGKVLPGRFPPYGFEYMSDIGNYRVDEGRMKVVRRIFRMVGAEGQAVRAVKRTLDSEGVPTTKGGRNWHHRTLTDIIGNDVYRPYTYAKISELVASEVAARLNPDGLYGIQWYNRKQTEKKSDDDKPRSVSLKEPSEWVAVPVPSAGVPLEHVVGARGPKKQRAALKRRPPGLAVEGLCVLSVWPSAEAL